MKGHIVKVLKTDLVTHNVKRFKVERPEGHSFIPGQATEISIHRPGFENELRPFTFTSLPDADYLEFIIKIYADHRGFTEKLLRVNEGDELIIHDVFGTIHYDGPGLFIAGGAGITPFISIFRYLQKQNRPSPDNVLLFANKTEEDIILGGELKAMLDDRYHDIIEISASSKPGRRIDYELLKQHMRPAHRCYYVCGPDAFTNAVVENLLQLGVLKSKIILEK